MRVGFAICGDVPVNVGWLRNCIVISSSSSNTEHAVSPPRLERCPPLKREGTDSITRILTSTLCSKAFVPITCLHQ